MQEKLTTDPFHFLLPAFCPHPSTSRKKEGSDAQRAEPNPEKTKAVLSPFWTIHYTVFVSQRDSKWGSAGRRGHYRLFLAFSWKVFQLHPLNLLNSVFLMVHILLKNVKKRVYCTNLPRIPMVQVYWNRRCLSAEKRSIKRFLPTN